MANLEGTDQFIIRRSGEYYTANYETITSGFDTPLAVQGDAYTGVAGKIIPGEIFNYDNQTGVLDIDLPQTMAFKGVIDEDYAEPIGDERNGDIYLVNVDPSDLRGYLVLDKASWDQDKGLIDVTLLHRGENYKGDTGAVSVFGDGTEIALQNVTTPESSYGLRLSTRLENGYIIAADTAVSVGGAGYNVGDIIRLKQYSPLIFDDSCAYIKVTSVASGSVTGIEFIENANDTTPNVDELIGSGQYFVPIGEPSTKSNVSTQGRNDLVTGTNLTVDIECHLGQVIKATISNLSSHNGYNDGDRVFLYNHNLRAVGDCELQVSVNTDPSNTFTVANNDKMIRAIVETPDGARSAWYHIKDTTSAITVTDIVPKFYSYAEPDFSNPQGALEIERNPTNRNQFQIAIRNAKFVDSGTGLADEFLSYAGLMTPEDKYKLDSVTRGISSVGSNFQNDTETGQLYKIIDIGIDDDVVNIKINDADIGRRGVVSVSSESDITNAILDYHQDNDTAAQTDDEVMSTDQVVTHFAPNNFYLLPAIQ